ncbi:MAG: substrate-binding domain-containing protein [Methanomicrobiales archaeon]
MKKTSMYYKIDNEAAVSPIVATLVLIVVAVVGAVAVGTIMGTFSSDVSKKTNAGDAADASSNTLLVAGSTTMQPVVQVVAGEYMKAHDGIKVNVQGGGSGAGLSGVYNNIVDVGMYSEDMSDATKKSYPEIKQYTVGKGAVVVIMKTGASYPTITFDAIEKAYNHADLTVLGSSVTTLYTRIDKSGTADTFGKAFGITNIYNVSSPIKGADGNSDMITKIKGDDHALGFTDFEYVFTDTTKAVTALPITGFPADLSKFDDIHAVEKGTNTTAYPLNLTRNLNLLTNGQPNPVVGNFIQFVQSPNAKTAFNAAGMTHTSEVMI